jgi:hypothetical protein
MWLVTELDREGVAMEGNYSSWLDKKSAHWKEKIAK